MYNNQIKIILCLFLSISFPGFAENADSIISEVLKSKKIYEHHIEEYNAQLYLKGSIEVTKKNRLFEYAPDFFYLNKDKDYSFVESLIKIHYKTPGYFDQKIIATNGDKVNVEDIQQRLSSFLNLNIYNSTLFGEYILLLSPKNIFKYYSFEYVDSSDTLTYKIHKIKIIPKVNSQKLVSGYIYVVDKIASIYKIDIAGRKEFSDFQMMVEFGLPQKNFLLPVKYNLVFRLDLFGNKSVHNYSGYMQYDSIKLYDRNKEKEEILFDLSNYYSLNNDSFLIVKDSLFWENERLLPLSEHEKLLMEHKDTIRKRTVIEKILDNSSGVFFPKKGQYNNMTAYYSGLLNPLSLSYSKMDGIVYWQRLRFSKLFDNAQKLQINPDVGFLLQKKEIYFNFPIQWTFSPGKFGSIDFAFRNDNKSFNSTIIEKINEIIPDSINFRDFNIDYYHHCHLELFSKYEITNGLTVQGGVDYEWYSPVKSSKKASVLKADNVDDDIVDLVSDNYYSFSPAVGLTWTPNQYYRFIGKEKEYIGSRFPTFSVEYARGIQGILQSNSDYERIEIDIQQKIPLDLMRSIHYYIGTGWFTNTNSVYFADFKYFRKRNIPESWNDPIGGVFHLLDGNWYNASNFYFQAHFMYESPFALLQLFKKVSRDILQERIYISQLYTPAIPCYTEIGYGFGNFLGNVGFFTSLNKGKPDSFGVKLAFDLNR